MLIDGESSATRQRVQSLFKDTRMVAEIRQRFGDRAMATPTSPLEGAGRSLLEAPETLAQNTALEAIVLLFGRPALIVQDDTFEVPAADEWRRRLYPTKSVLERSLKSVGRVEVMGHPSFTWLGTAWVVDDGVVVTNRHVAAEFARNREGRFVFMPNPEGRPMSARIDFKEEFARTGAIERSVKEILYIADDDSTFPDMAVLKLESGDGLTPLHLKQDFDYSDRERWIAAVGYPAKDFRNPEDALNKVFGTVYDVKRLSPGSVSSPGDTNGFTFVHDCSTLGGSSGSVILDVESGGAIGLHFAGRYQIGNYAVKAPKIFEVLNSLSLRVPAVTPVEPLTFEFTESKPASLKGRSGYKSDFLVSEVPLPKLTEDQVENAAESNSPSEGKDAYVLDYEHFSVVMNAKRRLAYFTASNIDGGEARNIRRTKDVWAYDLRIEKSEQIGEELYRGNDLDRGHLVRRLDPVWGSASVAKRAEIDTFHFTNCSPQHSGFNQKTWLGLEDYVLGNSGDNSMKISVFTGPVFRRSDPPYRDVQLPTQYWKVIAFEKEGELASAAYIISQKDLITDLEFVFGKYKTYQTSVRRIIELTDLDFGDLATVDVFGGTEMNDVRELVSLESMRL